MKSRYNLFNYIELLVRSFIFLFIINSFWFIRSTKLCFQASTIVSEWTKYSRGEVKFESIIQIKIVDAVKRSNWVRDRRYTVKKNQVCAGTITNPDCYMTSQTYCKSWRFPHPINQSINHYWSYDLTYREFKKYKKSGRGAPYYLADS